MTVPNSIKLAAKWLY